MKKDGITPQMPPNPAPSIINRLVEIGMTESTGMGSRPLPWREIEAWKNLTGIAIPAWEARLIHRLSTEYLAELHAAEDENRPAPWRGIITQRERDVDERKLRALLG